MKSWTKFVAILGGITFYLMNGIHYARQARQKNKKRYWLSRFFVGTKKMNLVGLPRSAHHSETWLILSSKIQSLIRQAGIIKPQII